VHDWSNIVDTFPLTVAQIFKQYTRLPADAGDVYYHYTTHEGLEGILRSGGLRARYRMGMNDPGEFSYARDVIYEELDNIGSRDDLRSYAKSLIIYTRKNLDKFLLDTTEMSRAFCACLTISPDDPNQWENYAGDGKGFAIGFNLYQLLKSQVMADLRGEPFILWAPVTYDEREQHDLVWRLVDAGICDLQTFKETRSQTIEDLTALRNRVTQEIVVQLLTLIDFIKAPTYSNEREMRLTLDPNDGTLKAHNIQYYENDNESIPFIFMDFRDPKMGRMPLVDIKIGPKAEFPKEKTYVENLLDELGYGMNCGDRPEITKSAAILSGSQGS
jgi:hypothetical protein